MYLRLWKFFSPCVSYKTNMSLIKMQIIYLKCYNIVKTKKNLLQPSRVEHNQSPPVELSKVRCNFALLLRATKYMQMSYFCNKKDTKKNGNEFLTFVKLIYK